MLNLSIKLPKEFHGIYGAMPPLDFNLKRGSYTLNGKLYSINLKSLNNIEVNMYSVHRLKKSLLITLYPAKNQLQ